MNASMRRRFIAPLLCLALLFPARLARARTIGTDVTLVVVAIVVGTAAITTGIILAIRHRPTVTGCVADEPNGLQLQNESDQQHFLLTGDTAAIKAGDRIKVEGKKKRTEASGAQQFIVEKLKKNYGACRIAPATT